jgi:6-phosphogluconolactonase
MSVFAYVGTRTSRERNARGEGISVYCLDQDRGSLELVQVLGGLENPSYLALNKANTYLYCVHGDKQEASVFSVEPNSGKLSHLQTVACGGKNPVHLALDRSERYLVVANHLSQNIALLDVQANGLLGDIRQIVTLEGEPGPHRKEQPFAKPHFNPFDPSGRFVVVPDKGLDKVFVFELREGALHAASRPYVQTRESAGPRNIAFHPSAPFAYVVNELDSTVTGYQFNRANGELSAIQCLPSVPDTFTATSRAASIEVSRDGKTLYASNRGADSIAAFRIDTESGRLQFLNTTPSGGKTPRFFTQTPNGKFLMVLNEDSDTIKVLPIEAGTGLLGAPTAGVDCASPVCMVFAEQVA